jgi:hypothetical protein
MMHRTPRGEVWGQRSEGSTVISREIGGIKEGNEAVVLSPTASIVAHA